MGGRYQPTGELLESEGGSGMTAIVKISRGVPGRSVYKMLI